MTRKERAITNLKQMCSDGRYLGSGSYAPLEVLKDFEVAIKSLEQEPVLDKIFCIVYPLSIMSTPELEHKAIMQIAEMLEPLCLAESEG